MLRELDEEAYLPQKYSQPANKDPSSDLMVLRPEVEVLAKEILSLRNKVFQDLGTITLTFAGVSFL